MDIPSHHQSAFFSAIHDAEDFSVRIIYRFPYSSSRRKQGWTDFALAPYESMLNGTTVSEQNINDILPDWLERKHILAIQLFPDVAAVLAINNVPFYHWSERGGMCVARLVKFNRMLYKLLLLPYIRLWKYREAKFLRKFAAGILCMGRLNRRYYEKMHIQASRLHELFYAVNPIANADKDPAIEHFKRGRKCFLFVGALYERKGITTLLRAWQKLHAPDWCLIFCGLDLCGGRYDKIIKENGLQDQIMFYGKCDNRNIGTIFAVADVFVFPSRYDGWGMVLQEAASTGLPLIGSDMAASSFEVIEEGKNGYICQAGNWKDLRKAMNHYVECPGLLAVHGKRSKEIFYEKMTPEQNVQRLRTALASDP